MCLGALLRSLHSHCSRGISGWEIESKNSLCFLGSVWGHGVTCARKIGRSCVWCGHLFQASSCNIYPLVQVVSETWLQWHWNLRNTRNVTRCIWKQVLSLSPAGFQSSPDPNARPSLQSWEKLQGWGTKRTMTLGYWIRRTGCQKLRLTLWIPRTCGPLSQVGPKPTSWLESVEVEMVDMSLGGSRFWHRIGPSQTCRTTSRTWQRVRRRAGEQQADTAKCANSGFSCIPSWEVPVKAVHPCYRKTGGGFA